MFALAGSSDGGLNMAVQFYSDYLKDEVLDHLWGATTFTPPATLYFGVFTARPSGSGGGTEVAISRISKTNNTTTWSAASSQVKRNAVIVDWGTAASDWGSILGIGIFDASSGGNLLAYGDLSTPRTILTGNPFSLAVSAIGLGWIDAS